MKTSKALDEVTSALDPLTSDDVTLQPNTATREHGDDTKAQVTELQPWQRPPFEPGHELSVKSGSRSPKLVSARARAVEIEIVENAPHLDVPEYTIAVSLLATAVARSRMIAEYVELVGIANVSVRLLEQATASDNVASRLAGQLGLDPRSFVELRAIGSLADVTEAQFARIAPAVPLAIAAALKALGLEDRLDEFNQAFVAALRGPQ